MIQPLAGNVIGVLKGESKKSSTIWMPTKDKGVKQLLEITAVGSDVHEVKIGDIAVLPDKWSGAILSVYDDVTDTTEELFVIKESALLAIIREE